MKLVDGELQLPRFEASARIVHVPVRHHSPACARHLRTLLLERRPDAVLIEGPRDAESLIPLLQHHGTVPPIALYCTWRDPAAGPAGHHASYYPLCAESPEWVAIRTAGAIGARVRFIDLTFAERVRAEQQHADDGPRSLLDESWLRHSRFVEAAVERAGVRDHDELWDHWFETRGDESPSEFFDRVLAWCAAGRSACSPEQLAAEANGAREAHMAACIAEERGTAFVVTGGLHTPVLAETEPARPRPREQDATEAAVTLMRYGDEQLDALSGYAAGMPSPGFYAMLANGTELERMLLEVARELRGTRGEPSVAETIAAVQHARGLMQLRGHVLPAREDVYDAVRSVFVKGSVDIEGAAVIATARRVFTGARRGCVPAHAGMPPIVADFERSATALGLRLGGTEEHDLVLDPYRKRRDRERSRLLHRLLLLDVPFADLVRGPDWVGGVELGRIQEMWRYRWKPATESHLIEASRYGAALREAAAQVCLRRLSDVDHGDARAARAAELLLRAALCGLHEQMAPITARTEALIQQDAEFISISTASLRLRMAQWACEPLELHDVSGIEALARTAWDRALYLLPDLAVLAEEQEGPGMDALCAFAETTADSDRHLLVEALWRLARPEQAAPNPVLAGAALGLLHGDAALADDQLAAGAAGWLLGARSQGAAPGRFMHGLLRTGRASVWQVAALREALHEALAACPEDQFLLMLPHLRLAFSELTPRETHRIAGDVAELLGERRWRPPSGPWPAEDALALRAVDAVLREELEKDGLEEWLR